MRFKGLHGISKALRGSQGLLRGLQRVPGAPGDLKDTDRRSQGPYRWPQGILGGFMGFRWSSRGFGGVFERFWRFQEEGCQKTSEVFQKGIRSVSGSLRVSQGRNTIDTPLKFPQPL